jgi:hypothetical protein
MHLPQCTMTLNAMQTSGKQTTRARFICSLKMVAVLHANLDGNLRPRSGNGMTAGAPAESSILKAFQAAALGNT